jgi:hypothetical protein
MLKNALARLVDKNGLALDTWPWRIKSPLLGVVPHLAHRPAGGHANFRKLLETASCAGARQPGRHQASRATARPSNQARAWRGVMWRAVRKRWQTACPNRFKGRKTNKKIFPSRKTAKSAKHYR